MHWHRRDLRRLFQTEIDGYWNKRVHAAVMEKEVAITKQLENIADSL